MDEEILSFEGAARPLGVSTRTIYNLARCGDIPPCASAASGAFARRNIIDWVAHGGEADKLKKALKNARVRKRK
jgi:predicted DNA-binding transcriptional regulator AlpA